MSQTFRPEPGAIQRLGLGYALLCIVTSLLVFAPAALAVRYYRLVSSALLTDSRVTVRRLAAWSVVVAGVVLAVNFVFFVSVGDDTQGLGTLLAYVMAIPFGSFVFVLVLSGLVGMYSGGATLANKLYAAMISLVVALLLFYGGYGYYQHAVSGQQVPEACNQQVLDDLNVLSGNREAC